MTLVLASDLTTIIRMPTQFTMFHHSFADPVNSGISAYGFVHWINHNHFIVQIGRILTNPVRVQHSKCTCQPTCSLLSFGASTTLKLDLVDTFPLWFTVSCTLWNGLLTSSSS